MYITEIDSSSSAESMVDILQAEYQLFKSAVYGNMPGVAVSRQQLLDEFVTLQQRHASLVASLLRSQATLQQVHFSTTLPSRNVFDHGLHVLMM